ncbi:Uncharacterised protein [Burkholderia pseudomallei]|uniref:hypothetical protein n=1 Tax=Burkholderia thailandensis TaxID=57975 RepID=UPI0005B6E85B|nr:hypothetical protein [Burkholderia thailandensis]KIS55178.1 hypothetical protein BTP_3508 [Burkholderia thailandensis Phuket 4W-1]MBF3788663.1 hypothetical protein [Burkholderia pseudomallei]CAJ5924884.1 Uncharacterised protein [Burkholderia pseudomallei]
MGVSLFDNFVDAYDRAARLYPALICLLPVVAVAAGVYGTVLSLNSALLTLVTSFGGLFLLMSVSRDLGKRLEPALFSSWGGKPTTQVLRHRDTTLDPVTKKRFHGFLEKHLEIAFPTTDEEAADPVAADSVYQSGTQWLLGKTRDRARFPLVFKENVNYGFRRNCLGLKPIGMLIAALAMAWTLAASGTLSATGISAPKIAEANIGAKVALIVNLGMLLIWTFLITPISVRRVAFAYADMLLRACDTLPKKQ